MLRQAAVHGRFLRMGAENWLPKGGGPPVPRLGEERRKQWGPPQGLSVPWTRGARQRDRKEAGARAQEELASELERVKDGRVWSAVRDEEAKRRRVEAQRDELKAEVQRLTEQANARSRRAKPRTLQMVSLCDCSVAQRSEKLENTTAVPP